MQAEFKFFYNFNNLCKKLYLTSVLEDMMFLAYFLSKETPFFLMISLVLCVHQLKFSVPLNSWNCVNFWKFSL